MLDVDNIHEIDIDENVFDDPYVEAATRAVEKCELKKYGSIRAVTKCWEKKDENFPRKHQLLNTYIILLNAALHKKAERLRKKLIMQEDVDLAKEPLRAAVKSK